MSEQAVWVTGIGAVTAAGPDASSLLEAMRAEHSFVAPVSELGGIAAARVRAFSRDKSSKHLDRSAAMFLAAASEAWSDAGLVTSHPTRTMVVEGSSMGPLAEVLTTHEALMLAKGRRTPRPSYLIRFMPGAGGVAFAQRHEVRGPVLQLSAGSVSAALAIGEAWEKIAFGSADVVVAGGAECPLQKEIIESFRAAGLVVSGENGRAACRPFADTRNGTVLGEGAGALVLESSHHAASRGKRPRAILRGFHAVSEGYSMTAPEPRGQGVQEAASNAMNDVSMDEIGWIKVHGTGTILNDAAECSGLFQLFGERLTRIPLSGLKPMIGHCLGASGVVEAVASILALEEGFVPATLGTRDIDPELPPIHVARRLEPSNGSSALLLSESFGGRCAAMVLSDSGAVSESA